MQNDVTSAHLWHFVNLRYANGLIIIITAVWALTDVNYNTCTCMQNWNRLHLPASIWVVIPVPYMHGKKEQAPTKTWKNIDIVNTWKANSVQTEIINMQLYQSICLLPVWPRYENLADDKINW